MVVDVLNVLKNIEKSLDFPIFLPHSMLVKKIQGGMGLERTENWKK